MTPLNNEQKTLILDYCLGLTSTQEAVEAEQLISSNEQAAKLHSAFKVSVAPLDSLEPELCPDELVESTILRLNNCARSSHLQLEELLAAEEARTPTVAISFWGNIGRRLAMAAVFIIVGTVVLSTMNFLRYKSRLQQCQMGLMQIGQGIKNYSSDHDGRLPAVAMAEGAPWWKVGDKGSENQSNTRHLWLLVKGDYVQPVSFLCPGRKHKVVAIDLSEVKNYSDFPTRGHITYSFKIGCNKSAGRKLAGRRVLMSDLNPLFERLPQSYADPFNLRPDKSLLKRNSANHKRHGQNVLFCDGGVEFKKTRSVGPSQDDIFTLQDVDTYQGVEVPAFEADDFLAP